tara:strand:- start:60 stop:554 length:495 start_codon:yes stop_codon:yes gene_type:complete
MKRLLLSLLAALALPTAVSAETITKTYLVSVSSKATGIPIIGILNPFTLIQSGGWVKIDVNKENDVKLTHFYDSRDSLTGKLKRYKHPILATRACPIKTFDDCKLGTNTIQLPSGTFFKDYSYEIKWYEAGKNYSIQIDKESLDNAEEWSEKDRADFNKIKIRN